MRRPEDSQWAPVSASREHRLARLDGAEVGNGVHLRVELGPRNRVGSGYFRAFLVSDDLGETLEPVLLGLHNSGPFPGYNWVEVIDFRGRVEVAGGAVEVPAGIDQEIVTALASMILPGGHLMIEYDSAHRSLTARSLAAQVPPVATPLGGMMFAAGCIAFTDWYIAEGGREGPRKLQGFLAVNDRHVQLRSREMLLDLEAFMERSRDLEWDVQAATRPLAEAAITVLRDRLDLPEGPFLVQ
jgi:hypothetical protein